MNTDRTTEGNADLARAIRHESAAAICYWWGAIAKTVAWWRKALGVSMYGTEGSKRLHNAACEAGASVTRDRPLPPDQVEVRRRNALANNQARFFAPHREAVKWKPEELALLGTMPDEEVAKRIGRTVEAVRVKRAKAGLRTVRDRRRK